MIEAKAFGICPGIEIAEALTKMLKQLKTEEQPCTVVFEKGIYYIYAEKLPVRKMYVTNTVGDNEWRPGEAPHENRAGFLLEGLRQVTLEGNGAEFILLGQATNIALLNCTDVVIRNLRITSFQPDMHELTVVKTGPFYADFQLDAESQYTKTQKGYCFIGEGYCTEFLDSRTTAHWIGKINGKDLGNLKRTGHPFCSAVRMREQKDHLFRIYDPAALRFKKGDRYELFDVRRKYNGIFIDQCQHIRLDGIEQNFNYGLALVAQNSDTLTFSNLRFAPRKEGPRLMASVADFIQICMCRGQVTIRDSIFEGAGDDCLNAHGIHFKIVKKEGNTITVRFMHPQSHGFNPLRIGDRITYVDPDTLLCSGESEILSSEQIDEYQILLHLNGPAKAECGAVIEDIDAAPDLTFEGNRLDRIITRGLLLTIRGRVRIRNNQFIHTTMNNILISDDAKSWYESGCVRDVVIEKNEFLACPEHTVSIKPENKRHAGAVHSGIVIRNNTILTPSYQIKSADRVAIYKNNNHRAAKMKITNSSVSEQKG